MPSAEQANKELVDDLLLAYDYPGDLFTNQAEPLELTLDGRDGFVVFVVQVLFRLFRHTRLSASPTQNTGLN